jgi:hypothetical protein
MAGLSNKAIVVKLAPEKVAQILQAAETQLNKEEYEELSELLNEFLSPWGAVLTPYLNTRVGTLMAKFNYTLEVSESGEYDPALQKCDEAFLLSELKNMCRDYNISAGRRHKKLLCVDLYLKNHPRVRAVMDPILNGRELVIPPEY